MKSLLVVLTLFISLGSFAQPFKPNAFGYVSGETFKNFCSKRQYSLIGAFTELPNENGMAAQVVKNGQWKYIDLKGREFPNHDSLAKFYGFYSPPSRYDYFVDDNLPVMERLPELIEIPGAKFTGSFESNGKQGYKINDKVIVQPLYDGVKRLNEIDNFLFFLVMKDDLYGLCDYQGNLITPIAYNYIEPLRQNSAECFFRATQNYTQRLILSRSGKVTVPGIYDQLEIRSVGEKFIVQTRRKDLYGAISSSGKVITEPIHHAVRVEYSQDPKSGVVVENNGLFGYYNLNGELKVPCEYKKLYYERGGDYLIYETETGTGVMDTNGVKLVAPIYSSVGKSLHGNCFIVSIKQDNTKLYGVLDLNGKTVVEPRFAKIRSFNPNDEKNVICLFSPMMDNQQTGFFNMKTLQWVLPCEYQILSFGGTYAEISKSNSDQSENVSLTGVVNKFGEIIIPLKYKDLHYHDTEGFATAQLDGKYGVIDSNNTILLPFNYDKLTYLTFQFNAPRTPRGYLAFEENGKKGVIHVSGKVTVPAAYDEIIATEYGIICMTGDQSKILSVDGKIFNAISSKIYPLYDGPGLFRSRDSNQGADLYGNTGTLPPLPVKRDPFMWEPEPVVVKEPEKVVDPNEVFTFVDEPAEYVGGKTAMMEFMGKNTKLPETAVELGIQCKSYIALIIETDGSISDVSVTRKCSDCPDCDKEAMEMVKKMPKWRPAMINGKAVRSKFILPIRFDTM